MFALRLSIRVTSIAVAALLLAGCSTAGHPAHADVTVGMTVTEAGALVPDGDAFVWYDLSPQVLHRPATLSQADGADGVIVAVCDGIGHGDVAVGVVPETDFDGAVSTAARKEEYRHFLPECAQARGHPRSAP
ncbi:MULTISPECIES: hypothetical protein [unclassified Curtobacterium]|nr:MULTISPECIES: hypothetical protein [unclassified Curtobacterium]KQR26611.1 hypothetical protein ASF75_16910 [Curtobacterium sp. Leaf154]OII04512.1 hypothetical protein BIU95_16370 [Curtobacterium sp. MCBA15_007]UXZ58034.1 hypothetical protein MXD64_01240 [Curtobacterium sp. Arg-1]